ncbi:MULTISPECIES: hypothetical protein [unclassified Clostridium]|uniref:hypothetical protein n=1 Tax=unclassified Clostridium TaxID=2614128 RepID=UPI0014867159|nr:MULTISPECIES: hypothetical protein [unclassified Clostridium]
MGNKRNWDSARFADGVGASVREPNRGGGAGITKIHSTHPLRTMASASFIFQIKKEKRYARIDGIPIEIKGL